MKNLLFEIFFYIILIVCFLIFSSPKTYKFTNKFLHKVCKICTRSGCPTICGILVHGLILLFILRIIFNFSLKEGNENIPHDFKAAENEAKKDIDEIATKIEMLEEGVGEIEESIDSKIGQMEDDINTQIQDTGTKIKEVQKKVDDNIKQGNITESKLISTAATTKKLEDQLINTAFNRLNNINNVSEYNNDSNIIEENFMNK